MRRRSVAWWHSGGVGCQDAGVEERFLASRNPLGRTGCFRVARWSGWLPAVGKASFWRGELQAPGDGLGHRLKPTRGALLRPPQKAAATQTGQIKRRLDRIEPPLHKFGIAAGRLLRHRRCFFRGLLRGFLRFLCHLPFPPDVRCPARSAYRLQSCARNISIRARTPSVKKISRFSSIFRIISEERWRRRRRSSRRAPGPSGPRGAHGLRCCGSRPYGRRAANRSGCIDCGLLR